MQEFETIEQAMESIEKAERMVSDLCNKRRDWVMSIPVREDYDPDTVIVKGLRAGRWLSENAYSEQWIDCAECGSSINPKGIVCSRCSTK
jgi:hypothetical protein